VSDLFGGADMARIMYGRDARHVPAFCYVQDQGPGLVSFIGSSMTPGRDHPLRYGAPHFSGSNHHDPGYRGHHLIVGELIVRPHVVIATSIGVGYALSQFLTDPPGIEEMITGGRGELVVGTSARLADIVYRSNTGAWRERAGG
jgi:hypothetical protein